MALGRTSHGNLQKHESHNPIQQWLLGRFHQRVGQLVQQTGAKELLDAGSGEGFLYYYLQKLGLQLSYWGSDIRWESLVWARSRWLGWNAGIVADIHHLPFASNQFPLVVCLEVLEHIPNSALGIQELARISSRHLILSVPHEPFFRTANFLRGKHLSQWGNDPEHLHNYSGAAFRHLVSQWLDIQWHGYAFPWQLIWATKRGSFLAAGGDSSQGNSK